MLKKLSLSRMAALGMIAGGTPPPPPPHVCVVGMGRDDMARRVAELPDHGPHVVVLDHLLTPPAITASLRATAADWDAAARVAAEAPPPRGQPNPRHEKGTAAAMNQRRQKRARRANRRG